MEENLKNVDLELFDKEKFTINNDPNRVIELDLSDTNVVVRLNEIYPKLVELAQNVSINEDSDMEEVAHFLKNTDLQMREYIDNIFDSKVCDACVPNGNMFDVKNGFFRFEIILEKLLALYNQNLDKELNKVKERVSKHTQKYVGK